MKVWPHSVFGDIAKFNIVSMFGSFMEAHFLWFLANCHSVLFLEHSSEL